jgi:phage-related minor tail protein
MAETIRGISVVISADTTKLGKALSNVEEKSKNIQNELKQVDKLLKFNPGNTEALAQKQKLLADQIQATAEKLNTLRNVEKQVQEQFQRGEIGEAQYRAFRREIEFTEISLNSLKNRLAQTEQEQQRIATATKQLETFFQATGKSVDDFAGTLGGRLTNAIKNGSASSQQLNAALEKIGRTALGTNIDIDKMKKALSSVDDGNSLKNVRKELNNLAKEAQEAEKSVGDLGVELENVAGALVAGGGIAGAIEKSLDVSTLKTKIDVTFEVPESSKEEVKEAIRTIESYGVDAEAALEGVRRQWALNKNASDEANAAIVKGAAAIASSYSGIDFTELIQEVNEISRELNITNEEALGLTNALLKIGFPPEQLDIIAEYGQQLQRAGYTAQEIQALFAAGIETGTWNIDNLLDGLKEGRIRVAEFGQEVPKAVKELLAGTGISAKQMQEWGKSVAAGGEQGSKAMQEIAAALNNVDNETKKNALGVAIFGTMYEDQGQNIIDTLLNAKNATVDFRTNQEQLNNTVAQMDESPAVQLQQAFQDLKTASEPLLGVIADVVSKIAEWVSNNPTLAATIAAIASTIGILLGAVMAISPIITAAIGLMGAFGLSIGAIAAPIGIAVAAIAGIIAIGVLLYKNWDTIKAKTTELGKNLKSKFEEIKSSVVSNVQNLLSNVTSKWESLRSSVSSKMSSIWSNVSSSWEKIRSSTVNKIQNLIDGAVSRFQSLVSAASNKFSAAKNAILNPIESAKNKVLGIIGKIKDAFSKLSLKIPKPKIPDIDVNWKKIGVGDLSVKIPTFSVNWHKVGGVFTKPIIFGNAGFGDVEEAIVPFEGSHARKIAGLIAKEMPQQQPAINITLNYTGNNINDAYTMVDIIERELGNRINTRLRMGGVKA